MNLSESSRGGFLFPGANLREGKNSRNFSLLPEERSESFARSETLLGICRSIPRIASKGEGGGGFSFTSNRERPKIDSSLPRSLSPYFGVRATVVVGIYASVGGLGQAKSPRKVSGSRVAPR